MPNMNLGDTRLIVDVCKAAGLLRNQAAYVLATAYWETARTMKPVREYGGEAYLRQKKYWPYVGMGYVQLTWKANYEKASKKLGVDFVASPKKLLEARYAAPILVTGMKEGWFTGKKLDDYLTVLATDYVGARRIVNGTDKASLIAGYARDFEAALKAAGYTSQKPSTGPVHGPPPLGTPIPGTEPSEPSVASPAPPVAEPKPSGGKTAAAAGIFAIIALSLATWWNEFTSWLSSLF